MIAAGDAATPGALKALLAQGKAASETLDNGLLPGMFTVGQRMKSGEMFIPEVLLSTRIVQARFDVLEPHYDAAERHSFGTVMLGTVEGDEHDIGNNIVGLMLQGAVFTVVSLGTASARVPSSKRRRSMVLSSSV